LGIRPVSNLINTPNWFSFIVAALAGVVGVVSLTEARSSTLIGVFISVTTIPAASDIGVSVAFGSWSEARGSAHQLILNVTVLAAVAIVGLPAQRALWRRIERRAAAPNTARTARLAAGSASRAIQPGPRQVAPTGRGGHSTR
jgi:NADH:ubiquinone oxidoreductase subunit K